MRLSLVPDTRREALARPPRGSRSLLVALLTTLALLASALVGTAGASATVRDDLSATCRGLTDTSFRDVADQPPAAQEAIGCLASYEITSGVSFNQYAPRATVSRQQMVLFLSRQFDHVVRHSQGLVRYPEAIPPAPLSDRPRLSREVRAAVDLMYALDVTTGTASGTFAANDVVTRAQMALFIARLQDAYADGLGASARYSPAGGGGFTDLPADPRVRNAVYSLQNAGVVQGTGPGRYSPSAPVSRVQMALFLMRHLDENVAPGRVGGIPPAVTIEDGLLVGWSGSFILVEHRGRVHNIYYDNPAPLIDATLRVDGQAATLAQFSSARSAGDRVDVSLYPEGTPRQGGGYAREIRLTNRIVESGYVRSYSLRSAAIGGGMNVELGSQTGSRFFTYVWRDRDDLRFTVDGRVVSQAELQDQVNIGDVVQLQDRRPDDRSWGTVALVNRPFVAVVIRANDFAGRVNLALEGRGDYVGSLNDNVVEGSPTQSVTIDGRPASFEDVEAEVDAGDLLTITRTGGVARYAFINRGD